ncbi:MAG: hypothetical protein JWL65_4835, partial [Gammaproteobacteria bacterium]|nr:hypothetical protein [Gammaproteobacteria bacterium]
ASRMYAKEIYDRTVTDEIQAGRREIRLQPLLPTLCPDHGGYCARRA